MGHLEKPYNVCSAIDDDEGTISVEHAFAAIY